jgi:hypothetical protein
MGAPTIHEYIGLSLKKMASRRKLLDKETAFGENMKKM